MGEVFMPKTECALQHKALEDKVAVHDVRLNNHAGRIDNLEKSETAHDVEIKQLVKSIDKLVTTIKWLIGIVISVTGLVVAIVS